MCEEKGRLPLCDPAGDCPCPGVQKWSILLHLGMRHESNKGFGTCGHRTNRQAGFPALGCYRNRIAITGPVEASGVEDGTVNAVLGQQPVQFGFGSIIERRVTDLHSISTIARQALQVLAQRLQAIRSDVEEYGDESCGDCHGDNGVAR